MMAVTTLTTVSSASEESAIEPVSHAATAFSASTAMPSPRLISASRATVDAESRNVESCAIRRAPLPLGAHSGPVWQGQVLVSANDFQQHSQMCQALD